MLPLPRTVNIPLLIYVFRATFWELMDYINRNPSPALPVGEFSEEFADFLSICLRKVGGTRGSAAELLTHPFIKQFEGVDKGFLVHWMNSDSLK
jgi:hypothetical protein